MKTLKELKKKFQTLIARPARIRHRSGLSRFGSVRVINHNNIITTDTARYVLLLSRAADLTVVFRVRGSDGERENQTQQDDEDAAAVTTTGHIVNARGYDEKRLRTVAFSRDDGGLYTPPFRRSVFKNKKTRHTPAAAVAARTNRFHCSPYLPRFVPIIRH